MDINTVLTNFRFQVGSHIQELPQGDVEADDVRRLQEDDRLASAFLQHNNGDIDKASHHVITCFQWRKKEDIASLSTQAFPQEVQQNVILFYHGEDKLGHKVLYFSVRKHFGTLDGLLKRFFIYLLEKEHRKDPSQKLVIVMDMVGAGLKHFNINMVKFFLSFFEMFYPSFLEHIIIYELPFVLSAAWKVVQSGLSTEAREKVIVVTQKEIQDYIDPAKLPLHMGGPNDDSHVTTNVESMTNSLEEFETSLSSEYVIMENDAIPDFKDVRKRNLSKSSKQSSRLDHRRATVHGEKVGEKPGESTGTPSSSLNIRDRFQTRNEKSELSQENSFVGRFLTVCPADQLVFRLGSATATDCQTSEQITLTNSSSETVAFKIKTTSPTDYRIRPSAGLIPSHSFLEINVQFRPNRSPSEVHPMSGLGTTVPGLTTVATNRSGDKLQLLAMLVPSEMSATEALVHLKASPKEAAMEHRLSCRFITEGEDPNAGIVTLESVAKDITKVQEKLSRMENNLEISLFFQKVLVVCVLILLVVVMFRSGIIGFHRK